MSTLITMLPALWMSVKLTVAIAIIGFPVGAALGFGMYLAPRAVGIAILIVTEIGRGFPALLVIYLVYFGLPRIDVILDPFPAIVVALAYTTASYTAEIFRSALVAVPTGQTDAGQAVGLSGFRILWHITGRQAARTALIPLFGFLILVFQGTSLAYSVGVQELMSVAYTKGVVEFEVKKYVLTGALLYLAVSLLLEAAIHLAFKEGSIRITIRSVKKYFRTVANS